MSLGSVGRPPTAMLSGRFFVMGYLPTCAAVSYLLVLVWAGAPRARPRFADAWRTAAGLGAGEVLLLLLGVTLLALVLHPLQLPLVRLLEGRWPRWCAPAARLGLRLQERHRHRLEREAELPGTQPPSAARTRTAGAASTALRARFPRRRELTRPTALGNVLAAMEDRSGAPYGWDAPVAWPRLYPLLGQRMRDVVEDRRDVLDAACRLAAAGAVCGVASLVLLARGGWWLLLAAAPLLLARLAYGAAVHAAVAYGEAVRVCFDLHRFELYPALHLQLPDDTAQERRVNEELCDFWRQGRPPGHPYVHPPPEPYPLLPQPQPYDPNTLPGQRDR